MTQVPHIRLNSGVEIPQFGFGVFQIDPADVGPALGTAFEAGYRHVDTAQMYRNEAEVGQAIVDSGLRRDEIFVTTKLDNDRHGHDEAVTALGESLDRLRLDHVDLFLVHWPRPAHDRYVETWKGFEKLAADGRARTIGVSNFQIPHLERLAAETGTVPAVNQIELHPHFPQEELRAYHREHGIVTEAWGPIGQGGDLLGDERLTALAEKYGRTPAQIVLRWHIELGNIVFPKSVTPARIRENIEVFDFELAAADMMTIAELDTGRRIGPNPDDFG
ncbi:aldo/keto reductase [Pseudonocardia sp.]|uniref:aldo/keto reductase n=1 Tax=Pseudonocardia sp. TaxID=60912 RepID=UPI00263127DB|nr:aldo/keto reductase [Pseudonocardia sp.]